MEPDPPLIVIAAGGSGSRMGGNKPERMLGDQRLIDRARHWADQQSDAVALAVRTGDSDWGTGLPLLHDAEADIGPISALHSALREGARQGREAVLLIGCDLPFLPDNLIARLSSALPGHGAAMPISAGRLHPMAALWRSNPDPLAEWIAGGGQSLWRYAEAIGMAQVAWEIAPDPFANVNDPDALAVAEERIRTEAR